MKTVLTALNYFNGARVSTFIKLPSYLGILIVARASKQLETDRCKTVRREFASGKSGSEY